MGQANYPLVVILAIGDLILDPLQRQFPQPLSFFDTCLLPECLCLLPLGKLRDVFVTMLGSPLRHVVLERMPSQSIKGLKIVDMICSKFT